MPPKTTSLIQPLDVYFFRMWKDFIRKISDRILLDQLDINLFQRDNILKLQSLTHTQFSSPRFKDFIKYAWFKAGYLTQKPDPHITPVQYCFDHKIYKEGCQKYMNLMLCNKSVFIKCAYCDQLLCFEHFYVELHDCITIAQDKTIEISISSDEEEDNIPIQIMDENISEEEDILGYN